MTSRETARLLLTARNGDLFSMDSAEVTESLEDEQGATCLHYAARGGSIPVLKHLINIRGFNASKRSKVGATALHDAAAAGCLTAVQWLLQNTDLKVDDQDDSGATMTHLSARYGHTQILEWLLDETNCDLLKKTTSGALPLHFAAERGQLECVKILVSEAPRSVNMQMNNGSTPVYLACQNGYLMTATFLASQNGTPKIHTFDGMLPLHAAAQMGHLHVVQWLIKEQGLKPNERDFGGATTLHYAASRGHSAVVQWLLQEGGARIILDNLGGSPLHTAAEFGDNRIVKTLLDNGCNRDITDNEGLTAKELAEKCGHNKTASILRGELPAKQVDVDLPVAATGTKNFNIESQQQRFIPTASSSKVTDPALKTSSILPAPEGFASTSGHSTLSSPEASIAADSFKKNSSVKVSSHSNSDESAKTGIHNYPSKVCIFNSQETGEREVRQCPLAIEATSQKTTAQPLLSSPAIPTSQQSSVIASLSSEHQHSFPDTAANSRQSNLSSTFCTENSREKQGAFEPWQRSAQGQNYRSDIDHCNTVAESQALNQDFGIHYFGSGTSTVEDTKMNGEIYQGNDSTKMNGEISEGKDSSTGAGPAKSVIKISNKNVTIISTGKDGATQPKITTTPFRDNNAHTLPSSHSNTLPSRASSQRNNTESISSLAQKFQGNGSSSHPTPIASSASFRNSKVQPLVVINGDSSSASVAAATSVKKNNSQTPAPVASSASFRNSNVRPLVATNNDSSSASVAAATSIKKSNTQSSAPVTSSVNVKKGDVSPITPHSIDASSVSVASFVNVKKSSFQPSTTPTPLSPIVQRHSSQPSTSPLSPNVQRHNSQPSTTPVVLSASNKSHSSHPSNTSVASSVSVKKDNVEPSSVSVASVEKNSLPPPSHPASVSSLPAFVANRKNDTEFIAALSQKLQLNGPSSRSLEEQEKRQKKSVVTAVAGVEHHSRQQTPEDEKLFSPMTNVMVNGHADSPSSSVVNGDIGCGSPDVVPPPPPPLPTAQQLSVNGQSTLRKPDASYTPRIKSPANGSLPGTPRGTVAADQSKMDLMAALTAVVTSGSPSARLRKTRGPGKGSVNEVYSKQTSGAATPAITEKHTSPLPLIEEFNPKNFLDKVADTDSAGNKLPDWKRQMLAKNLAQKAHEEYLEKKKVDEYEARFKGMPVWKRALIEKKESPPLKN